MFGLLNMGLGLVKSGFEYFNKRQEVDLEKYKVDGQVDMTLIQARAEVANARANDVVDRWGRRLFIYPTGVLYSLVALMSIIKDNPYLGKFYWTVHAIPGSMEYVPYAVVGYLLIAVAKR